MSETEPLRIIFCREANRANLALISVRRQSIRRGFCLSGVTAARKPKRFLFDGQFGVAIYELPAHFSKRREKFRPERAAAGFLRIEKLSKDVGIIGGSPESAVKMILREDRLH